MDDGGWFGEKVEFFIGAERTGGRVASRVDPHRGGS